MPEEESIKAVPKSQFANIIIVQAICVAVILLTIIATKYFFKDTFSQIREFYEQHICADTDINEVIGEKDEI